MHAFLYQLPVRPVELSMTMPMIVKNNAFIGEGQYDLSRIDCETYCNYRATNKELGFSYRLSPFRFPKKLVLYFKITLATKLLGSF